MKFTKIAKGTYRFEGIDTWNGAEISGVIAHNPIDVLLRQQWSVKFDGADDFAERFPTLTAAKKWFK